MTTTTTTDAGLPDAGGRAAVLTGAVVGCARVSTNAHVLDRQVHSLTAAGCLKVFTDVQSSREGPRRQTRPTVGWKSAAAGAGHFELAAVLRRTTTTSAASIQRSCLVRIGDLNHRTSS